MFTKKELAYQEFIGIYLCPVNYEEERLNQLNKNICDCEMMIQYAIDLSDKEKIAFFRKLLQ